MIKIFEPALIFDLTSSQISSNAVLSSSVLSVFLNIIFTTVDFSFPPVDFYILELILSLHW